MEYDDITIRDCMLSFTREEVLDNDEQPVSCSVALIYTVNPLWNGLILLDFNLFLFIGVKFINNDIDQNKSFQSSYNIDIV